MKQALLALMLCAGAMAGQDAPPPGPKPLAANATREQKDLRRRFNSVAARATANFASADSIEDSLRLYGVTLHPQLISLRVKIDATLRDAQALMDRGEVTDANEALDRAMGLLDRFAQRLGGD
jgi:hypothetical protein